jgi:hypothetical protein
MTESRCPADEDLLSLTSGESATPEIRDHVATCPGCRQRLAALEAEVSNLRRLVEGGILTEPTERSTPSGSEPPSTLGKYLIVGEAGQGDAAGYRAFHPTLRIELAIKLGAAPLAEDTAERSRLIREGSRLANVSHPALARVYDLDFHEDRPFLVWEYIRGPTLQEEFAGHPLGSPRRAAELTLQVASALEALHQQGILHPDLTPGSIRLDSNNQPRLVDPGWSLLQGPPSGTSPAAEQARQQTDLDRGGEVIRLAGLLYFLLMGEAPVAAPAVAESALRRAGAPRRLAAICLGALRAEAADRPDGVQRFAANLEWFLRRPRLLAWWLGFVTLGLMALAGWWLFRQG